MRNEKKMDSHTNDQLICYCDHVTQGEIIAALEQGAKTLSDIKRMTGACTSCQCAEKNPSGKCCSRDIACVMKDYWDANPGKAPKK